MAQNKSYCQLLSYIHTAVYVRRELAITLFCATVARSGSISALCVAIHSFKALKWYKHCVRKQNLCSDWCLTKSACNWATSSSRCSFSFRSSIAGMLEASATLSEIVRSSMISSLRLAFSDCSLSMWPTRWLNDVWLDDVGVVTVGDESSALPALLQHYHCWRRVLCFTCIVTTLSLGTVSDIPSLIMNMAGSEEGRSGGMVGEGSHGDVWGRIDSS